MLAQDLLQLCVLLCIHQVELGLLAFILDININDTYHLIGMEVGLIGGAWLPFHMLLYVS